MNKISALPEFFDQVHSQMQNELDTWVQAPTSINYEVVRGDCLWNIAQKQIFMQMDLHRRRCIKLIGIKLKIQI